MRYRSLIVFRLGGWSPLLPTGFHVSRGTLVPAIYCRFPLRVCHPLRRRFPSRFGSAIFECRKPSTPCVRRLTVWPLSSSLATTKEIEFSFFSSGYLDVSLPRVPLSQTMDSSVDDRALPRPGFPIRISRDHSLLATPPGFSQLIASFVGNQCPGIHPALLFA